MNLIGTGTYNPDAKFSVVRSYMTLVQISDTWGAPVQFANRFSYTPGGADPNNYNIVFWDHFWFPSTNFYSLDYIIAESYYIDLPSGIAHPMDFGLRYYPPIAGHGPAIWYQQFNIAGTFRRFTLPPIPPGYWLPPL